MQDQQQSSGDGEAITNLSTLGGTAALISSEPVRAFIGGKERLEVEPAG